MEFDFKYFLSYLYMHVSFFFSKIGLKIKLKRFLCFSIEIHKMWKVPFPVKWIAYITSVNVCMLIQ